MSGLRVGSLFEILQKYTTLPARGPTFEGMTLAHGAEWCVFRLLVTDLMDWTLVLPIRIGLVVLLVCRAGGRRMDLAANGNYNTPPTSIYLSSPHLRTLEAVPPRLRERSLMGGNAGIVFCFVGNCLYTRMTDQCMPPARFYVDYHGHALHHHTWLEH